MLKPLSMVRPSSVWAWVNVAAGKATVKVPPPEYVAEVPPPRVTSLVAEIRLVTTLLFVFVTLSPMMSDPPPFTVIGTLAAEMRPKFATVPAKMRDAVLSMVIPVVPDKSP